MSVSQLDPTCPDCSSAVFTSLAFGCTPETQFGEISHIYLQATTGKDFTDVEDLAEWTAAEAAIGVDKVWDLRVSAELPEAASTAVDIDDGKQVYPPKDFTINAEVFDVSEANYNELVRLLECNPLIKMWYSIPNLMFGGNAGIEANVKTNFVITKGVATLNTIKLVFTWKSKFSPIVSTNPFA